MICAAYDRRGHRQEASPYSFALPAARMCLAVTLEASFVSRMFRGGRKQRPDVAMKARRLLGSSVQLIKRIRNLH